MNEIPPASNIERYRPESQMTTVSQDLAMLSLFERLIMDPSVPIDRLEKMMAMSDKMRMDRARDSFTLAMSQMQPNLPTIDQNGCITITDKDDKDKPADQRRIIQSTKFAKWEDINETIRPVLGEFGFALTFKAIREGDRVVITGILRHRDGHQEVTDLPLALDTTGSKNNVQAVGSTISYGKRYTAGMLLNITSRAKPDADDDGNAACGPSYLDEEQVQTLRDKIELTKSNTKAFLDLAGAESLEKIHVDKYDMLTKKLEAKAMKEAAKAAKKDENP